MKISSLQGDFKVIQTIKNHDELLVLGSWQDLVRMFDSSRTFLVNRSESLFGIYLCKQECAEFMNKIIQDIDYNEWENFKIEAPTYHKQFQA
ncbi:hypothetical protein [Algoriphagus aquimarinus]|uniref:Uncharacterized protein n=1 Tax=Algoriphagus aquimarinus TaxID=237018 RepID=A0A1I0V7Z5_9BACT|nr:hypothetical protein [Algoriphagus aquimarinus]SFA72170.1 hypothetical protein SAMN04489723_10147 [Algoriphagus aquimarinus]|tara:strand:+ start:21930 stop:22205 length:276 start_codon:yes stop_codon:yes gene_type:complete